MVRILSVLPPLLGIALAWIFFFLIGRLLLLQPASLPNGSMSAPRSETRR